MKGQKFAGYVMLEGRKVFIHVQLGQTCDWVMALTRHLRPDESVEHLASYEKRLKKIHGARERLLNGRVQPLPVRRKAGRILVPAKEGA